MDAEIRAAHEAGLSYWAFCWFPSGSSFRVAWDLYQTSPINDRVNWCPILPAEALGAVPFQEGAWAPKVDMWVDHMIRPNFQKVDGHRPLIYLFYRSEEFSRWFGGADQNFKLILERLQQRCRASGLGMPYVVVLNPRADSDLLKRLGADATSNYISGFVRRRHGTFAELAEQTRRYWQRMARTGFDVVPIVQAGWDVRPRRIRPVPWESAPVLDADLYYAMASPAEFETHVAEASAFVRLRPQICPKRLILIYSWSECDEGGCIMPTRRDRTGAMLQALRRGLR